MSKSSNTALASSDGLDAWSMHSQPRDRYLDDDAPELQVNDMDDLPPSYSDQDQYTGNDAPLIPSTDQLARPDLACTFEDTATGNRVYLNRMLDNDPKYLESSVKLWANRPPRPFIKVRGTHQQTTENKGKRETSEVVDFDVQIELTPYLFSNAANGASWHELHTVDNGEKTKRGTIFKRRSPAARQSIEVGTEAKPTLLEWCHFYCASHAGLKAFSLKREMVGFDDENVRQKVTSLVRRTNYRGRVAVTFPVMDQVVEVYNDCKTNSWRMTSWVRWLCIFTLMFLFTWPYLYFRTKRWETVRARWLFSRFKEPGVKEYVSISEDQLYNMWGRALCRAVLEKRQCTLGQPDLISAEGIMPDFNTGHAAVDDSIGLLRASINAMNEVNRQLGWGGDC